MRLTYLVIIPVQFQFRFLGSRNWTFHIVFLSLPLRVKYGPLLLQMNSQVNTCPLGKRYVCTVKKPITH